MNYKKTILTTAIFAAIFTNVQATDYKIIVSQDEHNYDVVENSIPVFTSWIDIDTEFNCVKEFSEYDYPLGESFTQNENCLQKQERIVTTTETLNGKPRTTIQTENQNIPVIISYLETGKENFNTGTQRIESTDWLTDGGLYSCDTWIPLSSTIKSPKPLIQSRSCSEDKERTITVYDLWADGSETFNSTSQERKTDIINDSQNVLGTGQASSCKAILDAGWSTGSGMYEINIPSGDHNVMCDMVTNGGGWTRWWWYNGNGTFPNENDVLGYNFGEANINSSYGFQTLPSNISQSSTELLAKDGENTILKWDFANGGATATSVWNAFTVRSITLQGTILNNTPWNPSVIQGGATTVAQDSFMYREQSGVKSFILDDDGCDCATTLSAGASMCGTSWDVRYGGDMAFGVDNLKDLNCESTQPDKSMSMFYREK